MSKKLPDIETLRGHVKAGLSNRQIATLYGVGYEAVRLALAKEGIRNGPGRNDHSKYVPWRIRADHARHLLLRHLRAVSRREQGLPMTEQDLRRVDEWVAYMEGDNPWQVPMSVHYSRTDPDGFWLEPRREGDKDFISPPKGN